MKSLSHLSVGKVLRLISSGIQSVYFILALVIATCLVIFGVISLSGELKIYTISYFNTVFLVPIVLIAMLLGMILVQRTSSSNRQSQNKHFQYKLSKREYEVLQLIRDQKSNQEIADHLFVEKSTVKTHINNIYKKLGVTQRGDLIHLKGNFTFNL